MKLPDRTSLTDGTGNVEPGRRFRARPIRRLPRVRTDNGRRSSDPDLHVGHHDHVAHPGVGALRASEDSADFGGEQLAFLDVHPGHQIEKRAGKIVEQAALILGKRRVATCALRDFAKQLYRVAILMLVLVLRTKNRQRRSEPSLTSLIEKSLFSARSKAARKSSTACLIPSMSSPQPQPSAVRPVCQILRPTYRVPDHVIH